MPGPLKHHYTLWKLHLLCVCGAVALTVLAVWAIWREWHRPWVQYQAKGLNLIEGIRRDARAMESQPGVWSIGNSQGEVSFESGDDAPGHRTPHVKELVIPNLPVQVGQGRFERRDRCVSCHVLTELTIPQMSLVSSDDAVSAAERFPWERVTKPGNRLAPAFHRAGKIDLILSLVLDRVVQSTGHDGNQARRGRVSEQLGIIWSNGWWDRQEARIAAIEKGSAAESSGLVPGDRIVSLAGRFVTSRAEIEELLDKILVAAGNKARWAEWGLTETWFPAKFGDDAQPVPGVRMVVERGLPQPFPGHPRPDLFVHPESVHPASRFGCTICHDGQGLATDVIGAEHWSAVTRLIDKPWPAASASTHPMPPSLFLESRCLRCHDAVLDLVETDSIREPSGTRLVEGRRLIERFGCYACHQFDGTEAKTPLSAARLRPRGPAVEIAEEILMWNPPEAVEKAARGVMAAPYDSAKLQQFTAALESWATSPTNDAPGTVLESHRRWTLQQFVASLRTEKDIRGTLSKPGPSLRYAAAKLSRETLRARIANPQSIRSGAKMPRLFGINPDLESPNQFSRFETVEIDGIVEYLLSRSRTLEGQDRQETTDTPRDSAISPEREKRRQWGRVLFETQGCLACHAHEEYPGGGDLGPDLSNLRQHLDGPQGRQWLRRWLDDPAALSAGTAMPRPQFREDSWLYGLFTDEKPHPGESGKLSRSFSRPQLIEAIIEFLLEGTPTKQISKVIYKDDDLNRVVYEYLAEEVGSQKAVVYMTNGLSSEQLLKLNPAVALDLRELQAPLSREAKLRYIGKKAIGRYGCYACHDISGFEGRPGIGPDLSSWGQKPVALLDFARFEEYLGRTERGCAIVAEAHGELILAALLRQRRRETWLWLKLTEPRMFDYQAHLESPVHGLRMGRFPLGKNQRLAIMTFILGLDGYRPPEEYSPYRHRSRADLALGREVIERHGCDRCHLLRPEAWRVRYLTSSPPVPPSPAAAGGFLSTTGLTEQGTSHPMPHFAEAVLVGRPQRDPSGALLEDVDDWDNPLYFFELWQPAQIGPWIWPVGQAALPVARPQIVAQFDQHGGQWARQLYGRLAEYARAAGFMVGSTELWGAVPPPLCYEGTIVQESWLRSFLAQPHSIRPAVPLAMPSYRLSQLEIDLLVDYFRALAGASSDLVKSFREISAELAEREKRWPGRLEAAEKLIHDSVTYCAKCHRFTEESSGRLTTPLEAPPLDQVYRRLRGDYLERWVADPRAILPYTAMPVNFPPEGPLDRSVFDAPSEIQRQAVVDLLRFYDWYMWKTRGRSGPLHVNPPAERR